MKLTKEQRKNSLKEYLKIINGFLKEYEKIEIPAWKEYEIEEIDKEPEEQARLSNMKKALNETMEI
jgi:nucleoid DNA-binding protein